MENKKRISAIITLAISVILFSTLMYAQNDPVKNKEQNQVQTQPQEKTRTRLKIRFSKE